MNIFQVLFTQPILNFLIIFYKLFLFIHLPWALGFAIISLTVTIRLILWPLTTTQLRSTQKMAALKPHLERLKKEHGHDKVRHQQEISKLYKEHNVNPLAGCLPLILQIPIFFSLYNSLLKVVSLQGDTFLSGINDKLYFEFLKLNHLPDTHFFVFDLATKPKQWHEVGIFILLIPLITGVFQFIQSKMLSPVDLKPKQISKKEDSMEDAMSSMQGQMVFLMPAMIAFFSYGFPVGLALYWNAFTIIGIVQQYLVSGAGSLNKYLPLKWQR